jgi:Fe-S cluster biogenesis protein NfuA
MDELTDLLERLERSLEQLDHTDEPVRSTVFALLDDVDLLHRSAVRELVAAIGTDRAEQLAGRHPAIEWLFAAYAPDERAAADAALEEVRPFIHSHGGDVEVVDATDGIVRVRLAGACQGCSASAATLTHGVEDALRSQLPGFRALEVEEDDAPAHPPPGAPLPAAGAELPLFPTRA